MEPRSWKWIQAAVILVAAAVGIGAALWYQNRPVADTILPPAKVAARRKVPHPAQADIPINVGPVKLSGTSPSPTASAFPDSDAAVPTPSQSAVTSGQHVSVDWATHLPVTPVPGAVPLPGAPAVSSPSPTYGVPATGSPVGAAPATLPGPAAVPSSPPVTYGPSPSGSPADGTASPVGGTSTPASGTVGTTPGL